MFSRIKMLCLVCFAAIGMFAANPVAEADDVHIYDDSSFSYYIRDTGWGVEETNFYAQVVKKSRSSGETVRSALIYNFYQEYDEWYFYVQGYTDPAPVYEDNLAATIFKYMMP